MISHKTPEQKKLPIEYLVRGEYQPRRQFNQDSLQELADSIKTHGLIEPVIVRAISSNKYEIIAGERRWRASQLAGLSDIRCEIRELTDSEVAAITIIENIQREDLNPIEKANGYQRLIDEFGYLHEEVASEVGKSRSKITNALRLLKLDQTIQDLIINNQLSEGHGKILVCLNKEEQKMLANKCISRNWSVRKLEQEVKSLQQDSIKSDKQKDSNIKVLEQNLSSHLGSKVHINFDGVKGKLEVDWNNLDILEGILEKIGYKEE